MKESDMDNDINKLVRLHKHNYAGEFGNVVVDPLLSVLEELIKNPQLFEEEEKQRILDGLRKSLHSQGAYDLLGYVLSEQLTQLKDVIVPGINDNSELLKSILAKYRNFENPYLPDILKWSLEHTQSLSFKLLNIQNDDKGTSKPIPLLDFVEQLFIEDKEEKNRKGKSSFEYEIFGRELSDIQVFLEPDGFKNNVIHNIIENIHKYAFPETIYVAFKKKSLYEKLIERINYMLGLQKYITIEERKVRISLCQTPDETNMVSLIIENNGIPFDGEIDSIFNWGYHTGKGSGIGMFSAYEYINKYGGNIIAESTPNSEFTIRFIIKLPIYGKV